MCIRDSSCVTPWELTGVYATIARLGEKVQHVFIKRVVDRDGVVLEDHTAKDDPWVDHDVRIDWAAQTVASTITVTLTSTEPPPGLPPIVTANREGYPAGTNSANLFVLTPLEVDAIRIDAKEQETWVAQQEGALNRRGLPVVVPPGATVTVEFALSGPLDMEDGYRLTVLHQPVAVDDQLTLAVADTDDVTWIEQPDAEAPAAGEGPRSVSRTFETLFLAGE